MTTIPTPPAVPVKVPEWAVRATQAILHDYRVVELSAHQPLPSYGQRDMARFPEMPPERLARIIAKHYENRALALLPTPADGEDARRGRGLPEVHRTPGQAQAMGLLK